MQKAGQVKGNSVRWQTGEETKMNSLHIYKLKVVRRYIAGMFMIMITNQSIKRNKTCAKAIWRKLKTLLKEAKGHLKY